MTQIDPLHYTYAKMQEDLGDLSAAFDSYVAGVSLRAEFTCV